MKLRETRIVGFQSFADSGKIQFSDGMNLIIGQNNSGKSALLRALNPSLPDDRHRTVQIWDQVQIPHPFVKSQIEISGEELYSAIFRYGLSYFPSPQGVNAAEFAADVWSCRSIVLDATLTPHQGFTSRFERVPAFSGYKWEPDVWLGMQPRQGALHFSRTGTISDSSGPLLHTVYSRQMFYFSAERMSIGQSGHGHATRLSPTADNLPNVLDTLKGDRGDIFTELVNHLREIFPTVGNLSVRPVEGQNFIEVRVWPTVAMPRVELSFPLNNSGTGVAQVIAILTAVMTIEDAVIVIDEINSFLHPAAVKALLRILQTHYNQHQYIISTHAPEVISFSNAQTIHLVKRDGYESTVTPLSLSGVEKFREVAEHLGVAMSDVFAADHVVWVEGPTEELCFPLLYELAAGCTVPRGTVLTSVVATGDFMTKRRDKNLVYEIYERLSTAATPLHVTAVFSFDGEELSAAERDEMKRASRGRMHFLPRRHLECYVVDPVSIADFICARDPQSVGAVDAASVEAKLVELAASRDFLKAEWNGDLRNTAWLMVVDAANLISEACRELSEERVTFRKKNDTLFLLQHIIERSPEPVMEAADYVRSVVDGA